MAHPLDGLRGFSISPLDRWLSGMEFLGYTYHVSSVVSFIVRLAVPLPIPCPSPTRYVRKENHSSSELALDALASVLGRFSECLRQAGLVPVAPIPQGRVLL